MLSSALIFGAIFLTRCSDSETITCSTCEKSPSQTVALKINSESLEIKVYDFNDQSNHYQFGVTDARLTTQLKSQLIKILDLNGKLSYDVNNIVGIVPLIYGQLDQIESLSTALLFGAAIYYLEDGKILFDGFKIEDGQVFKMNQRPIKVKAISAQDLYLTSNIAREFEGTSAVTLALINYSILPSVNHSGSDLDYRMLDSEIKYKRPPVGDGGNGGGGSCNGMSPCGSQLGDKCIAGESPGGESWTCWADDCPKNTTETIVIQSGNNFSFDDSPLYLLRDSFLGNTDQGNQLISDYYYIGKILDTSNITLPIALDAMNIGFSTIGPIILDFVNNQQSSTILFDNTERDNMIDFIIDVKELSNDPQFIAILNNVITLVNQYANKTNNYVYTDFQN